MVVSAARHLAKSFGCKSGRKTEVIDSGIHWSDRTSRDSVPEVHERPFPSIHGHDMIPELIGSGALEVPVRQGNVVTRVSRFLRVRGLHAVTHVPTEIEEAAGGEVHRGRRR